MVEFAPDLVASMWIVVSTLSAVGIGSYVIIKPMVKAPRTIRKSNEQYSPDMPLLELQSLYNRLLPASRYARGKTRRLGEELVDRVEHKLLEHVVEECSGLEDTGVKGAILQSPTFLNTFNKHYYSKKDCRRPSDYVLSMMGAQTFHVLDSSRT